MGDVAELLVITSDAGDRFVEASSLVAWMRDQARRVASDSLLSSRAVFDACAFAVERSVIDAAPVDPLAMLEPSPRAHDDTSGV